MIIIATCADMIMMDGTNPPPAQTYHIYVISVELFSDQVGRQLFLILEEMFEYSYCILLFLIKFCIQISSQLQYLIPIMSLLYRPYPKSGGTENESARAHDNCNCKIDISDSFSVSSQRLSFFLIISNRATAKDTVPNNDAMPIRQKSRFIQ